MKKATQIHVPIRFRSWAYTLAGQPTVLANVEVVTTRETFLEDVLDVVQKIVPMHGWHYVDGKQFGEPTLAAAAEIGLRSGYRRPHKGAGPRLSWDYMCLSGRRLFNLKTPGVSAMHWYQEYGAADFSGMFRFCTKPTNLCKFVPDLVEGKDIPKTFVYNNRTGKSHYRMHNMVELLAREFATRWHGRLQKLAETEPRNSFYGVWDPAFRM